jgi:hypothetical protein
LWWSLLKEAAVNEYSCARLLAAEAHTAQKRAIDHDYCPGALCADVPVLLPDQLKSRASVL